MSKNPLQTLVTVLAGSALTPLVALTVKTWAAMYLPLRTAWPIGVAIAFIPGFFLNKVLTRSYRQIEPDATEMGSIFGTLALLNVAVAACLFIGIAGLPADVAMEETLTRSYATLGFLDKPLEATLAPYPRSTTGTGVIWVPNLGTNERPRVIVRNAEGDLKAEYLPPRGKVFESAHNAVVGPVDETAKTVMLCPVPTDKGVACTEVNAVYPGGRALFKFSPTEARAYFFTK